MEIPRSNWAASGACFFKLALDAGFSQNLVTMKRNEPVIGNSLPLLPLTSWLLCVVPPHESIALCGQERCKFMSDSVCKQVGIYSHPHKNPLCPLCTGPHFPQGAHNEEEKMG